MYSFSVDVKASFDEAIDKVTAALKDEGFGVLTDIDFAGTIKKKLDIDRPAYRILGACNPPLANQAVNADVNAGVLRPAAYAGTVAYGTAGSIPTAEWVSFGMSSTTVTDRASAYINGVVSIDDAGISSNDYGSSTNWYFGNSSEVGAKNSDALYAHFFLWDRELTAEEHLSISADPYQFLIPA